MFINFILIIYILKNELKLNFFVNCILKKYFNE